MGSPRFFTVLFLAQLPIALPVLGQPTIVTPQGNTLNITGGTTSIDGKNLFHVLDRFNINTGQTANFQTQSTIRNILTRISGGEPSLIDGLLKVSGSNANLYLLNPSGILFGPNARLDLGGNFFGSTASGIQFGNQSWNGDRNANVNALTGDPTHLIFGPNASAVINAGNLSVATGKSLTLMGSSVANTGTLTAPGGQISIVAVPGSQSVQMQTVDNILKFEFKPIGSLNQTLQTWSPNSFSQLLAKGQGLRHATQLETTPDGKIKLTGANLTIATPTPTVIASGTINTSSHESGGTVNILGDRIAVENANVNANVNANGKTGGTILVGGDYQGMGNLPRATQNYVGKNGRLNANGLNTGNGGKIVVWSDQNTQFLGTANANGGTQGGNGGSIEISGRQNLGFAGQASTAAPNGTAGKILFDPKEIIIGSVSPSLTTLPSPTILDTDLPNITPLYLAPEAIFNSSGEILLAATDRILISGERSPSLNLGSGQTITFRAGQEFISAVSLLSQERSIVIEAPVIKTQLIDTSLASRLNQSGGKITLTGLNGDRATVVGFSNLITPHQDIQIAADRVDGQFLITSASTGRSGTPTIEGKVTIQANQLVTIGGALTDGKSVEITSNLTARTGKIQSGLLLTNGGDVNLAAARVNAGSVWTSAADNNHTNGNAGNITITADTELTGNRLEANAKNAGTAGTVNVVSQKGDIILDSIQAYGGANGGVVILEGDRIRIQASAIDRMGSNVGVPYNFTSIHAGTAISITHKGGKLNQPFTIGNASNNGSEDKLQVGNQALTQEQFPIKSTTTITTPSPGIIITGVNTRPTFPGLDNITSYPITVQPGRKTQFTLQELGISSIQDAEQDQTKLYIRLKDHFATQGQLFNASGGLITNLEEVKLTDRLTYVPGDISDNPRLDRFELVLMDLAPTEENIAQSRRISLNFLSPLRIPDPIATAPTNRQAELPEDSGMSNVSLADVAVLDGEMSKDFEGETPSSNLAAGLDGTLARAIEQKTGARPAMIYLRTLRRSADSSNAASNAASNANSNTASNAASNTAEDTLEFTVLTARGRFRRRIPINYAKLMEQVVQLRREITNPLRTHTTSYLPPAQELYKLLIAPLKSDLNTQGVTNLVFLAEAGLRSVPYGVLHDGKQFLIEQYSLGLMPSLGLTQTEYHNLRNASLLMVGVSKSTQQQTALPMVQTELATIARIWGKSNQYLNDLATLKTLQTTKQTQNFQIVHLATHANFISGKPKDAYIQLWNDRLQLGQMKDLNWNKPGLDLLVLSACRTAVGDRESELGFAGLAVKTGVKTTIASLWSVNDTATMGLMSKFYDGLLRSPLKGEALRQAQLAMLRGKVVIQDNQLIGVTSTGAIGLPRELETSNSNFIHPYYWAAFTVVGNPW
jgi:filamentous hemagglutinin family protein